MNNEYIIVNKTLLEKRIEELEKERKIMWWLERDTLKQILSQSIPLIPEIDAAIQFGKDVRGSNTFINTYDHNTPFIDYYDTTTETCQYISDLKLDI